MKRPEALLGDGDAEFGYLVIRWKEKKILLRGMPGDEPNMPPAEVVKAVRRFSKNPDVTVYAVMFWLDVRQLCLYDELEFLTQVYGEDYAKEATKAGVRSGKRTRKRRSAGSDRSG